MSRQEMTKAEAENVLKLPERYTAQDLRQAHVRLARAFHPDNAEKNGISKGLAQREMVKANQAYARLKGYFSDGTSIMVREGAAGSGVSFTPDGSHARKTQVADALFWDEQGRPRGSSEVESEQDLSDVPGHKLRRVLLGPVLLRVVFVALFGLLWWNVFPALPHGGSMPALPETPLAWASWLCAVGYPTYLLLYELMSGHVSGTVREFLNWIVTNTTGVHVNIRRAGSYVSEVSSLVGRQAWALLLPPLGFELLAHAFAVQDGPARWVLLALSILVFVDTAASLFGGGIASGLATALAERLENLYVCMRMAMLKRCGQWEISTKNAAAAPGSAQGHTRPAQASARYGAHAKQASHGRHAAHAKQASHGRHAAHQSF